MAPFTFEGAVLPEIGADERGVRECPLCPPWIVACAHYGDSSVRLSERDAWRAYLSACGHCLFDAMPFGVSGNGLEQAKCGHLRFAGPLRLVFGFETEAEARAEFERRCELMRQEAE